MVEAHCELIKYACEHQPLLTPGKTSNTRLGVVVIYASPVEAFATRIKIELSDQCSF